MHVSLGPYREPAAPDIAAPKRPNRAVTGFLLTCVVWTLAGPNGIAAALAPDVDGWFLLGAIFFQLPITFGAAVMSLYVIARHWHGPHRSASFVSAVLALAAQLAWVLAALQANGRSC